MKVIFLSLFIVLSINAEISFEKDIKPILDERCISCHRKAYEEVRRGRKKIRKPRGGIQLDDRKKALIFSDEDTNEKLIDITNPKKSLIYQAITLPEGDDDIMPPKGSKLTNKQIKAIVSWMSQGAKWPDKYKNIEYVKPKK